MNLFMSVILFLGDSITEGVNGPVTSGQEFVSLVKNSIQGTSINGGVSGNTSAQCLARLPALLVNNPDIVVIMCGTNDCAIVSGVPQQSVDQFENNIVLMIKYCKKARAKVVLMTPPPLTNGNAPVRTNAGMKPYVEVIRKLSMRYKLKLVDNYQHFSELSQEGQSLGSFLYDFAHPNMLGHQEIAGCILKALRSKKR